MALAQQRSNAAVGAGHSAAVAAAAGGGLGGDEVAETQALMAARAALKVDPRSRLEKQADAGRTAFWAPAVTPDFGVSGPEAAVARPDPSTRDPVSGSLLKAKDLIKVLLTPAGAVGAGAGAGSGAAGASGAGAASEGAAAAGDARFMCPACLRGIVFQRTHLLRRCGHVLCDGCVQRLVLPAKECSECSAPVGGAADLVALQVGGSSFVAGAGTQAEASRVGFALIC